MMAGDDLSEGGSVVPFREPGAPSVTALQRKVISHMVHGGMRRKEAAEAAGTSDRNARFMFKRPAFLQAYRQELSALRESERARSIGRLVELRDQDDSKKVAFEASKFLAGDPEEKGGAGITVNVGVNVAPGYTVVLREDERSEVEALLKASGSTRDVLDLQAERRT